MIIPAIGALGTGGMSLQNAASTAPEALTQGAAAPEAALSTPEVQAPEAGGGEGGFGGALTQAISSLEGSQRSADAASQALATGTAKDPESAVVTVEDASLSMQLAAQIRQKATEATQSIFQTQV